MLEPLDIQTLVQNEFALLTESARPEAVSVRVCPPSHRAIAEADARLVGPDLARALYPSRRFRGVLAVEPAADAPGCFDVAVEAA